MNNPAGRLQRLERRFEDERLSGCAACRVGRIEVLDRYVDERGEAYEIDDAGNPPRPPCPCGAPRRDSRVSAIVIAPYIPRRLARGRPAAEAETMTGAEAIAFYRASGETAMADTIESMIGEGRWTRGEC